MTTRKTPPTEVELAALAEWYETNSTAGEPGEWIDVDAARDPSVVRSVRLRRSTVVRVNAVAKTHGLGPTELIRRWVEERLEAEDNPSEAGARLTLLRGVTDAIVREMGVPGVTVKITADRAGVDTGTVPTPSVSQVAVPSPGKAVQGAAAAKRTAGLQAHEAAPTRVDRNLPVTGPRGGGKRAVAAKAVLGKTASAHRSP
jgi:hypothetical protein